MEILKEMINVLNKNRIRNIDIIEVNSKKKNKINELFNGIESGRFQNDEEAANYFYGPNSKEKDSYKKVKKAASKKVDQYNIFIDVNQANYNETQKAYYASYKDLAAVKILLGKFARRTAIPIADRILKTASKFEFSDLALDVARILRNHYGIIEIDRKKYSFYDQHVQKNIELLNAELIAEEYYQTIVSLNNNPKNNQQEIEKLAISYTKELKKITSYLHSYRLNLNSFLIFVLRFQIVNDYRNMQKECEKAVEYFESKSYEISKNTIYIFLRKNLVCCVQLKEFKKGRTNRAKMP